MVAAAVTACGGNDDWSPSAQFAPSLQPAFGARVTDGQLRIWTGSPCTGVTRLALTFNPDQADRADLVLTSPTNEGAHVEHLTLGGPYPGLEISEPLPDGFDWRSARSLRMVISASRDGWGSTSDLTQVVTGSTQHGTDAYWFQDIGWLTAADVAAQDGKTFLATCTSDPAKD
ncbi:hypothetical protein H7J87_03190 [Mycolicibacterium wolinskyi]|uniref:Uncharacterized protein n=1 Tax=Mycolicibacterium wolinskyi TaxID=59750 RepID=A0A1X2FGD3_9MYCO|nr:MULTISPECIES: hypothetical protein [Mycolicibacterium]MCV7284326.1 hypothetical protein [Mycolicibacterium wolinskyi]MCV7294162.1 hypothetical protein [Mycolicibacterium goodii]ORX17474.1 hypothetical protein AWC31_17390 [Mycolicibacterium wolinskyi]